MRTGLISKSKNRLKYRLTVSNPAEVAKLINGMNLRTISQYVTPIVVIPLEKVLEN